MKTLCCHPEMNAGKSKVPRVLIVDDSVDIANIMSLLLQDIGFYVGAAYHPTVALSKCEKQSFDFFVLDIGLPEITGYDLIQVIRKIKANENATFFAYSAYDGTEFKQMSLAVGFKKHFVKPNDFLKIIEEITKCSGLQR